MHGTQRSHTGQSHGDSILERLHSLELHVSSVQIPLVVLPKPQHVDIDLKPRERP